MLDKLTLDDFADKIDETFNCPLEDNEPVEFKLVEAAHQNTSGPAADGMRESFSLVFTAPNEYRFEQGIFPLQHPELGNLDIFMVPVGEADDCIQYQAIFN